MNLNHNSVYGNATSSTKQITIGKKNQCAFWFYINMINENKYYNRLQFNLNMHENNAQANQTIFKLKFIP